MVAAMFYTLRRHFTAPLGPKPLIYFA